MRALLLALVLGACPTTTTPATSSSGPAASPAAARDAAASPPPAPGGPMSAAASDGRLEIRLEIQPGASPETPPMRVALLRLKNVSGAPLRVYLPQAEAFRAGISSLFFQPRGGDPLFVPEPHPHGYVVTEVDFPLLQPGEERTFTQPFTIDPYQPGKAAPARLFGFAAGSEVAVSWFYENKIEEWRGGVQTLDGPTKALFGGGKIPYIWTGKLIAKTTWIVD